MLDTSKTLAAAAAVLLAASIAGTGSERTETARHAPSIAAPLENHRGPAGRMTGPSITATGPNTPGR